MQLVARTGVVMIALLAVGSPARANDANELLQEGIARYLEGDFRGSLRLLDRARRIARDSLSSGRIWFYLGVNHKTLGNDHAAKRAFIAALSHDPETTADAKKFKPSIVALFRRVKAKARGTLSVVAPAGAEVIVDDRVLGRAPLSVRLPIGVHKLQVRSARGTHSEQVTIALNQEARVAASLGDPSPEPEQQPLFERRARRPEPIAGRRVRVDQRTQRTAINWPAWTSLGVAVGAAAGGIAFGVLSQENVDRQSDPTVAYDEAVGIHDTAVSQAVAANILFVVAGAATVVASVLYYYGWRKNARRVRALVVPGASSLAAQLRW